jgi:hypothetical protein
LPIIRVTEIVAAEIDKGWVLRSTGGKIWGGEVHRFIGSFACKLRSTEIAEHDFDLEAGAPADFTHH